MARTARPRKTAMSTTGNPTWSYSFPKTRLAITPNAVEIASKTGIQCSLTVFVVER